MDDGPHLLDRGTDVVCALGQWTTRPRPSAARLFQLLARDSANSAPHGFASTDRKCRINHVVISWETRCGLGSRLRVDARGLWEHEKFEAFAEADCFALPSQTENFGNAAAEAA